MSANNQTLVKEYCGKWYVFENIMAESWCHYDSKIKQHDENRLNELELSCGKEFSTDVDAIKYALEVESTIDDIGYMGTEYGIGTCLIKDGADVTIID